MISDFTVMLHFPFSCSVLGLLDSEGECVPIAVYNAAPTWAVVLGDSVSVQNPQLTKHDVEHEGKVRLEPVPAI